MNPLLNLVQYELADYETAISNLQITCQQGEEIIINALNQCYAISVSQTLDYFNQPMMIDLTIGRITDLIKLNDLMIEMYEYITNIVTDPQLQSILDSLYQFAEYLITMDEKYGTILSTFAIHRNLMTRVYNQVIPQLNSQDCPTNTRIIIRKLKDCYVDIMTIRLDQLRQYLQTKNKNMTISAVNDLRTSLYFQIVIRDYDSFVASQVMKAPRNVSHLKFRNLLIPLYNQSEILLNQLAVDQLNDIQINTFVDGIQQYLNTTVHGTLE